MKKYSIFIRALMIGTSLFFTFFYPATISFSQMKSSGKVEPFLTGTYNSLYSPYKARELTIRDTSLMEVVLPIERLS